MYYNIKIITKDSELALESTDRFIIEREMDLYFVRMFGASEEFKSSIRQIKIQKPKPEISLKIDTPQVKNKQQNNINIKPQAQAENIELINKNFEPVKPAQNTINTQPAKDNNENKEQNISSNSTNFEDKNFTAKETQTEQISHISDSHTNTTVLDVKNEIKQENQPVENKEDISVLDTKNAIEQESKQNIIDSLYENRLDNITGETIPTPSIEKVELEQAAEELFEQLQNEINNQHKDDNKTKEEIKTKEKPLIQAEKPQEKQIPVEIELENIYKDINKPQEPPKQEVKSPEPNTVLKEENNITEDFAKNDERFNIDDDVEIEFDDAKFKENEAILPTNDESIISQANQQLKQNMQEDNAGQKSGILYTYTSEEIQEKSPYQDIINVYKECGLYSKETSSSTQPIEENVSLIPEINDIEIIQPSITPNIDIQDNTEAKSESNNGIPNQTFDKYLSTFAVNEIHDEFLVCASYLKNILKQSDFAIKTANANLFQATGKIADTTIVDELIQKEYIKTIIVNDFTKYAITPNGEAYITGKLTK